MSDLTAAPTAYQSIRTHKTILGHPAGLFVLFFTEMWERFSYYGMRALLTLYMADYLFKGITEGRFHVLGFEGVRRGLEFVHGPQNIQPLASLFYGLYTALVYLTPLGGGYIADRFIGQRKAVILGGFLMAFGQFFLTNESTFVAGLLFLILGNGFFKPNLASQVGKLYPPGDSRLDRAYTIYYMGVNLGALLAALISGTLGQLWGWKYGFGAAGVGMILGIVQYSLGGRYLPRDTISRSSQVVKVEKVPLTPHQRKAILGLIALVFLNVIFWAVYEQQGNTLQIFADRNADWHVFGWQMPSTWFQSVNPLFILILTPFLNMFWSWQLKRKREPSSIIKMAMGCLILGLSFIPLILITQGLGDTQRISFLWLVFGTFLLTIGEIYLSPIGQSLVSQVAPPHLVSMLMGMWFLSNFMGNYLTGYLGTFYEKMSRDSFFLMLAVLGLIAGAAILAFNKPLRNAMGQGKA